MSSHASVTLVGRVGKDPESRSTSGGKTVVSFSIAVEDGFGDRATTSWFDISVWDKLAEAVPKFVKRGAMVLVEGTIRIREYTDNSGNKRKATEVTGQTVKRLDTKSEGSSAAAPAAAQPARAVAQRPATAVATRPPSDDTGITDDDIPW